MAQCHIKLKSAHEAATAYQDAANCYKKVDSSHAVLVYKEAVAIQIDLGRFTTAAKLQKEIADLCESDGDTAGAMDAYQQAADWYQAEESTSAANQCLLKVGRTLPLTLTPGRAAARAARRLRGRPSPKPSPSPSPDPSPNPSPKPSPTPKP